MRHEWNDGSAMPCETTSPRPSSYKKSASAGSRLRLTLVVLLLVLTLVGLTRLSYAQPSSERSDVVELSVEQADSLLITIKDLEISLWECRELAAQDSLFAEERLELVEKSYEEILQAYRDDRPGWLERLVKQPVVWLALGMWIGVQAQ